VGRSRRGGSDGDEGGGAFDNAPAAQLLSKSLPRLCRSRLSQFRTSFLEQAVAQSLKPGDRLYAPVIKLAPDANVTNAVSMVEVLSVSKRTATVKLDPPLGGEQTATIANSALVRNVGIMILRIGDFDTEYTLLDPLAKSLLQYFRLLVPDDIVVLKEFRALDELRTILTKNHAAYSHLILIGHGSTSSLRFGKEEVGASEFGKALEDSGCRGKVLVSLACLTGVASFAKCLSESPACEAVIAPFHSVQGAVASQFCQTLFAHNLLEGRSTKVAFRNARAAVPGTASFRLWVGGEMTAD
jgi:hypothetical protein